MPENPRGDFLTHTVHGVVDWGYYGAARCTVARPLLGPTTTTTVVAAVDVLDMVTLNPLATWQNIVVVVVIAVLSKVANCNDYQGNRTSQVATYTSE